ncbi:O-acetylhomoserine aminocarboxypropyltransferase/cysteine synthase family protein [Desulfotalea psychrophila]|uniref:Probable O-acetylhomoserine sulfhydrylase n=1 Tax=Desulfotalea psychrophila (strain LSv54 / DSM 12343) TaxID=177439 RepID=Q6AMJ6_DESPS|nr:O-acetylhomoserine aminocarboxypropyltransferase/cysteine synthase family protein [Desulfotalea psychrophila]CAG36429.1 probable O-acetylhomoserine sulfhydrylase [Desulfotalea psychrophila LSv54]
MKNWHIDTLAVQAGYEPKNGEPRIVPIAQSTTFKYDTAGAIADLFDLKAAGHMYSRISNPTVAVFEDKIAAMEGGVGALAVSSGQAASTISVINICQAGDHFIALATLYGGTFNLFKHSMKKWGIEVTFVDPAASPEEIKAAFKDNTKLIFGESLSNPGTDVLDFEKFVAIKNEMGVPLIVDNTFPTPILCRPIELGADIVTHSTTKYIDGHATSVGGIIIDSGNFDWTNGKFPGLTEPDDSYHGLSYTETFGKAAYIVKARVQWIRDIGCYQTPQNAFLSNLGLETLHLRMERHSENALRLAEFLDGHDKVEWVKYPMLPADSNYALCKKYLSAGSGVLTFGVKGSAQDAEKIMNSLQLAAIVVHVADVRTGVLHPASMTHRQLSSEDLEKAGITPQLIRVSVGIEKIDDIIADFKQALAQL